ncbi:MAG: hypothetical protein ABIH39_08295 [Candidatus Margulisiibacteriota bacterium]
MKNIFKAVFDKIDQYLTKKSAEKPCCCSADHKEKDSCCTNNKEDKSCCS